MPMAGQLDIGFAHDSPLWRGFLRRPINARADPHKGTCRLNDRRSSAENFAAITTMLRLLCRSLAPVHSLSLCIEHSRIATGSACGTRNDFDQDTRGKGEPCRNVDSHPTQRQMPAAIPATGICAQVAASQTITPPAISCGRKPPNRARPPAIAAKGKYEVCDCQLRQNAG